MDETPEQLIARLWPHQWLRVPVRQVVETYRRVLPDHAHDLEICDALLELAQRLDTFPSARQLREAVLDLREEEVGSDRRRYLYGGLSSA